MNSLVILVAVLAILVQAGVCSHYTGAYGWAGVGNGYAAAPAHAAAPYHGPLASPVVLPSGYLADTPEVAAAKGAHAALLGAASYGAGAYGDGASAEHAAKWHGPLAKPVVLPSGFLADTPEVVALRHAHLSAVSSGYAHGHAGYYGHY